MWLILLAAAWGYKPAYPGCKVDHSGATICKAMVLDAKSMQLSNAKEITQTDCDLANSSASCTSEVSPPGTLNLLAVEITVQMPDKRMVVLGCDPRRYPEGVLGVIVPKLVERVDPPRDCAGPEVGADVQLKFQEGSKKIHVRWPSHATADAKSITTTKIKPAGTIDETYKVLKAADQSPTPPTP